MPAAIRLPADTPAPKRRGARAATPAPPAPPRRRTLQFVLLFVTLVLIANALIGERGLMETIRARQRYQQLAESLEQLRAENARLRDEARRLRTDPATIEALARRELGLIRPGELLFIVKDARPAPSSIR